MDAEQQFKLRKPFSDSYKLIFPWETDENNNSSKVEPTTETVSKPSEKECESIFLFARYGWNVYSSDYMDIFKFEQIVEDIANICLIYIRTNLPYNIQIQIFDLPATQRYYAKQFEKQR